jgi:hypothetical protein
MFGINISTSMFSIRKTCWGMLGIITIGSIEPAVSAAIPETQAIVRSTKLAAEPSLANVLSGNTIPTSIKLKELTPEWRVMSTNGQFEIGNFQAFVGLFAGGSFATNYYTKGQTVSIGSETYIVAYSLLSLADKVSPEMPLNLSLLNLKTIGSMSNIRGFETIAETKVLEKQLASLQVANIFDSNKATEGVKDKPPEPNNNPVEAPIIKQEEFNRKPTVHKKIRSTRKYRRRQMRRNKYQRYSNHRQR